MARLIIESGGAPREVTLSELCRIGRDPSNELALDDNGSSRKHCRIAREGDGFVLEDLKSANGTFVNEERIDRVRLRDGDRIRIGATELRFDGADDDGPMEIQLEDPADASTSRFAILFTTGEKQGDRFPIGERLTIGRKASNTVSVADPKISGAHAELVIEDGRPVLRDLGSTNGTFLEGKRVDEIVLDHGDRVSLGDGEFVLIDSTKPEPDLAPRFVEDAERTIVDVPKVKVVHDVSRSRGSPLALIGLLVLVGALGAAGWFYWSVQRKTRAVAEAPPPEGNMLGTAWSFESTEDGADPSTTWVLADGTDDAFEVAVAGGKSGLQCLTAAIEGQPAVATMVDPLETTGRAYRVTGSARAEGDATAILVARFGVADAPESAVSVPIGAVSDGGWTEVEKEVTPPPKANRLWLQLVAAGGRGEVWFDDIGVFEGAISSGDVKKVAQFEFLRAGESVFVDRGGDRVLRIGALSFSSPSGSSHPADRFLAGNDVVLADGRRAGYAATLTTDARTASWNVEWKNVAGDAADQATVPLTLLPPLSDSSVGLLRDGRLEPYNEAFEVDAVQGLILGQGASRMRITLSAPVTVVGRPGENRFELALRPGLADGRLNMRMQVDFVEEKTQAATLLNEAREAESSGRLGAALKILDRIANEFPFDEPTLAEAEDRRGRILRERETLADRLREAAERAEFLKSPAAYRFAEEQAAEAATAFADSQWAADFDSRREALAADRESYLRSVQEHEADLLLRRVETALAQSPPNENVAREIASYLGDAYPWSDAARSAAEKVKN